MPDSGDTKRAGGKWFYYFTASDGVPTDGWYDEARLKKLGMRVDFPLPDPPAHKSNTYVPPKPSAPDWWPKELGVWPPQRPVMGTDKAGNKVATDRMELDLDKVKLGLDLSKALGGFEGTPAPQLRSAPDGSLIMVYADGLYDVVMEAPTESEQDKIEYRNAPDGSLIAIYPDGVTTPRVVWPAPPKEEAGPVYRDAPDGSLVAIDPDGTVRVIIAASGEGGYITELEGAPGYFVRTDANGNPVTNPFRLDQPEEETRPGADRFIPQEDGSQIVVDEFGRFQQRIPPPDRPSVQELIAQALIDGDNERALELDDFSKRPSQMQQLQASLDLARSPADYMTVVGMLRGELPMQAQADQFQRIGPPSQAFEAVNRFTQEPTFDATRQRFAGQAQPMQGQRFAQPGAYPSLDVSPPAGLPRFPDPTPPDYFASLIEAAGGEANFVAIMDAATQIDPGLSGVLTANVPAARLEQLRAMLSADGTAAMPPEEGLAAMQTATAKVDATWPQRQAQYQAERDAMGMGTPGLNKPGSNIPGFYDPRNAPVEQPKPTGGAVDLSTPEGRAYQAKWGTIAGQQYTESSGGEAPPPQRFPASRTLQATPNAPSMSNGTGTYRFANTGGYPSFLREALGENLLNRGAEQPRKSFASLGGLPARSLQTQRFQTPTERRFYETAGELQGISREDLLEQERRQVEIGTPRRQRARFVGVR